MANVVHSPIGFHARPVTHAPSPFGFGFGLSSSNISTGWSPSPAFANPSALHQFTSAMNQQHSSTPSTHTNTHNVPSASSSRLGKRRHDQEEQDDDPQGSTPSDQSMADRSPTPEKPRRIIPKRARMTDSGLGNDKSKENKAPGGSDGDNVEVGLLLGACFSAFEDCLSTIAFNREFADQLAAPINSISYFESPRIETSHSEVDS